MTNLPSTPQAGPRLLAVDMTRALAMLGMIAVHVGAGFYPQSGLWRILSLCTGYASGGFAVLSGVSLSLAANNNGRDAGWRVVLLRSLFLFVLGLLLNEVSVAPAVILCVYAALFLIAALFQRLNGKTLLLLGLLGVVALPALSLWLRNRLGPVSDTLGGVVSLEMLGSSNAWRVVLQTLFLDGVYPIFVWLPLALVGWGVHRMGMLDFSKTRVLSAAVLVVLALGFLLPVVFERFFHPRANAIESLRVVLVKAAKDAAKDESQVNELGLAEGITFTEAKTKIIKLRMPTNESLAQAIDYGFGVSVVNNASMLLMAGHHVGTPLEMLQILGVTGAVFLLMRFLLRVFPDHWVGLAWVGRVSLSVYVLHIVVQAVLENTGVVRMGLPPNTMLFVLALYWYGAFLLGWLCRNGKGPFEWLLARVLRLGRRAGHRL